MPLNHLDAETRVVLGGLPIPVSSLEHTLFITKESPGCRILDAWGWCTGTTQREGMGREEGGGFRMGNTGIPVADSC